MSSLVVKEIGLYRNLKYNEQTRTWSGTPVSTVVATEGQISPSLYLRIGGNPGSYWLVVELKTPHPDYLADLAPSYVEIPADGDTNLAIELPLVDPPLGTYILTVSAASVELAKLKFVIEPKP